MTIDRRTYLAGQAMRIYWQANVAVPKIPAAHIVSIADAVLAELQRTCEHAYFIDGRPEVNPKHIRFCIHCGLEKPAEPSDV